MMRELQPHTRRIVMSGPVHELVIEVVDIQGHCPVYHLGDRFGIREGYKLVADRPVCMHALQSVCPY